jgi:hypothetical protein
MTIACPPWAAMLIGPFAETQAAHPRIIDMRDNDHDALEILMNIIHLRFSKLPKTNKLTIEKLGCLARLLGSAYGQILRHKVGGFPHRDVDREAGRQRYSVFGPEGVLVRRCFVNLLGVWYPSAFEVVCTLLAWSTTPAELRATSRVPPDAIGMLGYFRAWQTVIDIILQTQS